MEYVFRSIKLIIGALLLLPLLWAASCSLLGVGAVYAVKEAAGPLKTAAIKHVKTEAQRRRDARVNRDAGWGTHAYDDRDGGYAHHYDDEY